VGAASKTLATANSRSLLAASPAGPPVEAVSVWSGERGRRGRENGECASTAMLLLPNAPPPDSCATMVRERKGVLEGGFAQAQARMAAMAVSATKRC
jgi:hypothetical protein